MKLIIHTDGSTQHGNPSKRGVAAFVAKNEEGVYQGRGTSDNSGAKITSNEMEFKAVKMALRHLDYYQESGTSPSYNTYTHVEIRSDSTLVVQVLNREWVCKAANLKPMVKEIWELCDKLPQVISFKWIPRAENVEADALSKSLYAD